MTFKNKDVYTGTFHEGKRNGKGEQKFSDGRFYSGDWIDDKKEGKGKMTMKNK